MTLAAEGLLVGWSHRALLDAGTLSFSPGTVTAILGPNGVGKSTLLRTLVGLMPPVVGRVVLDGRDLATWTRRDRALALAFLAQEETAAFPMSVREAVAIGRLPHSAGLRETPRDLRAIDDAIARVGLADRSEESLERLSGGQRRRATIARALAQEAEIILLDEPLAHLDPAHANEVLRTLAALRRAGNTILATFHEVDAALAIADRVLLLAEGEIVFAGAPSELPNALLARAYGLPFSSSGSGPSLVRHPKWQID